MSRAMKDSGVAWIGEIPEGWRTNTVFQLFDQVKNKNSDLREKNLLSLSYGRIIRKDIETTDGLLPESFDGYNIIEAGDIVLRLTDLQNDHRSLRVGLATERGIVTSAYITIRPREGTVPKYLYYVLHAFDISKGFYGMGAGVRQGLNWDGIKWLKVLAPSVAEQICIAAFLDCRCAEIDRVIATTQRTIEEYKKLKQSIITEAVTHGVCGPRKMKDSGVEWIGEIPEEWECKPIKYVAVFQPTCDTSHLTEDSEITYIPMECLKNGYFVANTGRYGALASSLTPFADGDIAMAKVTPCFENGNIAIMDGLCSGFGMGSSELFIYRPYAILAQYLLYWLQNDLFKQAACATMTGTGGLKRVSPYFAKHSKIPVPDEEEQFQIVKHLASRCAEIDRLIDAKQQLLTQLETYKKSVIYEYVTGKREVQA